MSIEVKGLCFSYGDRQILKELSFTVQKGELLSILGANGVGKSTLFRCMLGLCTSYGGEVLIDGDEARSLSAREMARRVAYIPQTTAPAFNYCVRDIVLMGTSSTLSAFGTPGRADRERAERALSKVGISGLGERCFHHLSGGEKQLCLIARALVQNAPVLLLDEPTASLDFGNQMLVLSQARALADEGYSVVQTTHNPEHAYLFSDEVLAMKDGAIMARGTPQEVISAELMSRLYGLELAGASLFDDRVRVFTPKEAIGKEERRRR